MTSNPLILNTLLIPLIFIYYQGTFDSTPTEPFSNRFKPSVMTGVIQNDFLEEASGLVASRINKGLFWVINDSGNEPKLFLINEQGALIHSYHIAESTNTDWEDMAIYTHPVTGESTIYIGDIGDNRALRTCINVLAIEEPEFTDTRDTIISEHIKYNFRYEDGPRDAETLLVDPVSSGLFIITKREENVRLYKAPEMMSEVDTMQLVYQSSLPVHNVTSGDISSDGSEILLKTYDSVLFWKRKKSKAIYEAMAREHELIMYTVEPQGESIAWSWKNDGFFTLSEKSWASSQILYFYEKSN